ncbi:MAG TPA: hypothetical protein VHO91_06725 [Rhodopila sp.]|nr:hypothetical protein [Rhodopila sp.]
MSALAHLLEEQGFSTVAIAGSRTQAVKTRPPRALWTTAQLGRPLGEPADPAHQRRVLMAALGLLECSDGPVILEDFLEDPPSWADNHEWQPPAVPAWQPGQTPDQWRASFQAELSAMMPAWQRAQARFGRSSVGLSFQPPADWAAFATRFLAGELPAVPQLDTPALALRFLCDDIKALYGEAAQADGPTPSARQIDGWFWRQTVAGALLIALRTAAIQSENNALKTVGGRFFVPVPWLPA